MSINWRTLGPLLIIISIGAWLRLDHIGSLPPGLYRDEAFYGLDAAAILQGRWALYFAANNGREPLFMYWLALFIAIFGRTVEAVRSASAVIGILTIPAIYFAGRWLFSARVGMLSAAALAVNFWHLAISRVAYRAITLPLLLCLAMGCVAWAAQSNGQIRRGRMIAAGALFGLTFYTYTSAQMLLPFGVVFCVIAMAANRIGASLRPAPTMQNAILPFCVGLIAALSPLGVWLTRHSDLFFNRAGQVSILNPIINHGDFWGTLLDNIGKAAGMFATQGDRIWRHNLSLRPVFDGLVAPFFLIGVMVVLWRVWQWLRTSPNPQPGKAALVLLLWLSIFLVPTILAEDTPHYLRAIGALPAACIVLAIGLEASLAWLSKQGYLMGLYFFTRPFRGWVTPPALAATFVLGISLIGTRADYFDNYVKNPLTGYWLESHNVALAQIQQTPPTTQLYLDQRLANDNPALQFLAPQAYAPSTQVIAEGKAIVVTPTQPALIIFDPNYDWATLRNALPHPAQFNAMLGALAQGDKDPQPRRAFVGITVAPIAATPVSNNIAQFEGGIELMAASTLTQSPATVTLIWRTRQPIREDFAVFVHVLRGGNLIAQHDSSPAYGLFPMPTWQVGDQIVDLHPLMTQSNANTPTAALDINPSTDQILVGIYRRSDGQRLTIISENNKTLRDSVMIFPTK